MEKVEIAYPRPLFQVIDSYSISSFDVYSIHDEKMRSTYMYLGTGKQVDSTWFHPLQGESKRTKAGAEEGAEAAGVGDGGEEAAETCATLEELGGIQIGDEGEENRGQENLRNIENDFDAKNCEAVQLKFKEALEVLNKTIEDRVSGDVKGFEKSVNSFASQVQKISKIKSDSALHKVLFNFGKSATQAISLGKRKKLGRIPVQVTARSRRVFKIRGKRPAKAGAPTKQQALKRQLEVTEEEEILRHKLPGPSKKSKKKQVHKLSKAVEENRSASKKH